MERHVKGGTDRPEISASDARRRAVGPWNVPDHPEFEQAPASAIACARVYAPGWAQPAGEPAGRIRTGRRSHPRIVLLRCRAGGRANSIVSIRAAGAVSSASDSRHAVAVDQADPPVLEQRVGVQFRHVEVRGIGRDHAVDLPDRLADRRRDVYLQERVVLPGLNGRLGELFDLDHRDETVAALLASQSAPDSGAEAVCRDDAKQRLTDAETRLSRLRRAIEAGAEPEALIGSLNAVQAQRTAARAELSVLKGGPRC